MITSSLGNDGRIADRAFSVASSSSAALGVS